MGIPLTNHPSGSWRLFDGYRRARRPSLLWSSFSSRRNVATRSLSSKFSAVKDSGIFKSLLQWRHTEASSRTSSAQNGQRIGCLMLGHVKLENQRSRTSIFVLHIRTDNMHAGRYVSFRYIDSGWFGEVFDATRQIDEGISNVSELE